MLNCSVARAGRMTEDDPKVPPGWKLIGGGNPAFQMMIPISQEERRAAKAMSASGACSKASSWKPPFEQLGPNNAQHAETGIQPPHVKGPGTMHQQPSQAAQQPPTPDTVPPGPAHKPQGTALPGQQWQPHTVPPPGQSWQPTQQLSTSMP